MYTYLNCEVEDSAVEIKWLVTICIHLRSTVNKDRGRIDTYIETSYTKVIQNDEMISKYIMRD